MSDAGQTPHDAPPHDDEPPTSDPGSPAMMGGRDDAESPAYIIKRKADPDIARRASIAIALALILGLAIWPLGSNRFLALHALTAVVGMLMIATLGGWGVPRSQLVATLRRNVFVAIISLLVIIWAFAQAIVPVPPEWAHPAWDIASAGLGEQLPGYIAIDRTRALFESTKLALACAVFTIALLACRDRKTAALMVKMLAAIISLYAIYGVVSAGMRIPHSWFVGFEGPFPTTSRRGSGPLVSPNHFASLCGYGAIACFAVITSKTGEIVMERGARVFLRTLAHFVFSKNGLWISGLFACLGGMLASGSRAAGLSVVLALGVFALLVALRAPRGRRTAPVLVGLALLALALGVIFLGGSIVTDRLDQLARSGDPLRLRMWRAAIDGINASPWLGFGLGGFQTYFDTVVKLSWPMAVDYAHSDLLEFVFSLGVPAAIAWFVMMLLLMVRQVRALFYRRRDHHILAAGIAAMIFAAFHASVDSSLSIPGVACVFAALLGASCAQCVRRGEAVSGRQTDESTES